MSVPILGPILQIIATGWGHLSKLWSAKNTKEMRERDQDKKERARVDAIRRELEEKDDEAIRNRLSH